MSRNIIRWLLNFGAKTKEPPIEDVNEQNNVGILSEQGKKISRHRNVLKEGGERRARNSNKKLPFRFK